MSRPSSDTSARNNAWGLIIFCGVLTALSAFSTDIVLPAFTEMSRDLDAPVEWVQGTIPAFSGSFAFAQLLLGPASDRFGRRAIVAAGLIICVIGVMVATVGTTVTEVLVGRAIQGFGCAAGPVLARAMLRDSHSGERLANAMAATMAIFAIGPLTAPVLGYFLVDLYGWRAVFVAMAVLSIILILVNIFWLKETLPDERRQSLSPRKVFKGSISVFQNNQSRYFLLLVTCAYCALLSFVANAPRLYETQFGIDGLEFALLFAGAGLGIILGQIGNRLILNKFGILSSLRLAGLILFLSTASTAILVSVDMITVTNFTFLMFMFNTSFLVVLANGSTLVIDPHPHIAGIASALFGFVTLFAASLYAASTFAFFGGSLLPWATGMSILTGLTLIGALLRNKSSIQLSTEHS